MEPGQMNKKSFRIIVIIILIAALVSVVWYVNRPKPIMVIVKTIAHGKVESTVANTRAGTVMACRRARLAPTSGGQIAKLPVHEGDQVKAGQILLEMWNDDINAELLLAQKDAAAAGARAEEACVTADVAKKEARRITSLRKKKLVSEEESDRAVGEAKARNAACRAVKAGTEVSAAKVKVVEAAMERTVLRAPFDGTIAKVNGELGEFVTPSPVGVPTLPAIDLIDNSCLYVAAPIDEVDAPAIRADMQARISLDALPDKRFKANVRRVAPYVLDREKQARTVDIEVDFFDQADSLNLLPGYSADVEVVINVKDNVVRVPTEAIQEDDHVLVYLPEQGLVEKRKIKIGISNWVYTEVVSGLTSGEQVVTTVEREGLADGVRVKPESATNK